jgi:uncharacterized protein (TIGR02588 family)
MSSLSEGDDTPSTAELTVMVISVVVTALLFGYVAWHATTTQPDATPVATVMETETLADGRVAVTLELYNPGREGLKSVTVSVDCANESLTFTHVPTDARRRGTLLCQGDVEDPSASVLNWVET